MVSILTEQGTLYHFSAVPPAEAARIERLMRNTRTLLVDIRFTPASVAPEWNRHRLTARYGVRYVWERRLSSQAARFHEDRQIFAPGYEQAIGQLAAYLRQGIPLVLICACQQTHTCQRSVIAKLIQDALTRQDGGQRREAAPEEEAGCENLL